MGRPKIDSNKAVNEWRCSKCQMFFTQSKLERGPTLTEGSKTNVEFRVITL